MPYRITNTSPGPVLLRLRSGQTIHLAAGARTDELEGPEVNANPRIGSLAERRLVRVEETTPEPEPQSASRSRSAGRKPSGKDQPADPGDPAK